MGVFSNAVFLVIFIFNAKSFPRLCLISLRKKITLTKNVGELNIHALTNIYIVNLG